MENELARFWHSIFSRGVLLLIFGLTAIILPGMTISLLAMIMGLFILLDGALTFLTRKNIKRIDGHWWIFSFEGLTGIIIGFIAFIWPSFAVKMLVVIMSVVAFIAGLMQLAAAAALRGQSNYDRVLTLTGILTILFSLLFVFSPEKGAVLIIWIVGGFSLFFGGILILLGRQLKSMAQSEPIGYQIENRKN